MTGTYHDGNRLLQDQFDTRRLADRIDERLVDDVIDSDERMGDRRPTCHRSGATCNLNSWAFRTAVRNGVEP